MKNSPQPQNEISHGRLLAQGDPESTWGWGSPAGKVRAQRRAQLIAEGAGLGRAKRILEIGCGTGLFTQMFASLCPGEITAIDISPELLAMAQRRGLAPDRVRFVNIALDAMTGISAFDAVIGSSILHHLPLETSLQKMYDLLSPGGSLCFAEPNMLNPQIALQKNIPWLKRMLGDSPDETAFVRWRLAKALKRAGFTNIRIRPFDWLHPAVPWPLVAAVSAAGRIMESMPVVAEFAGSLCVKAEKP
jgi:SAM-dependent methyltransferase